MLNIRQLYFWLTLFFLSTNSFAQVVLTEVMFDPSGSESHDEFIEIFNLSKTDSFDLAGWQVSDGFGFDTIISSGSGLVLRPGRFAVILDASYFQNSNSYDVIIPDSVLILTVDNPTLGSTGLSNSTPETISLYDNTGQVISAYTYSLDNKSGFSDEKIELYGDNLPSNWSNSLIKKGSPGARNTVTPRAFDLAISDKDLSFTLRADSTLQIVAIAHNVGLQTISNFEVNFSLDVNKDDVAQSEEIVGIVSLSQALSSHDSVAIVFENKPNPGRSRFIVEIISIEDENPLNNHASGDFYLPVPVASIVISEIYFRPSKNFPEWLEFVNRSSQTISIEDWTFSDKSGTRAEFGHNIPTIPPKALFVVSQDSSIFASLPRETIGVVPSKWPTLNNAGDQIILKDPVGNTIDSLTYTSDWGGDIGVSVEKIIIDGSSTIPENWGSSEDSSGSTPGRANSLSPRDFDLGLDTKSIRVLPLAPKAGDDLNIVITVYNVGLEPVSNFSIRAADDLNFDMRIENKEIIDAPLFFTGPLSSGDSTQFDLVYREVSAGIHPILVNVDFTEDEKPENNIAVTSISVSFHEGIVRISEIMYSPASGQAEWVELINTSDEPISLLNWQLSDVSPDKKRIPESVIDAGAYFVLAQDSSIKQIIAKDVHFVTLEQWPSLNNSSDRIALFDFTGAVIDSLTFYSTWGGGSGFSLEKRGVNGQAIEPTNWGTSEDSSGSTPGRINSLSPRNFDLSLKPTGFQFQPKTPKAGNDVEILFSVFNSGLQSASRFVVDIADDLSMDRRIQGEEIIETALYTGLLAPGDSTSFSLQYLNLSAGTHSIVAEIVFSSDQVIKNNKADSVLKVSFPPGVLRINEIMYSPYSNEPEWVEFLNVSHQIISLRDWALSDNTLNDAALVEKDIFLQPNEFVVMSSASIPESASKFITLSAWPSLNNSSDQVVLYDLTGSTIDSLRYLSSWGGSEGLSLEKINPVLPGTDSTNWSSSAALSGHTLGKPNSIFAENLPVSTKLNISPNPFSPNGDSHDDFALISYQLPTATAAINIKIFDLRGRLIRFLANNKPSGSSDTIIWDGRDNNGRRASIGIYVVFLQAINAKEGALVTHKKTVVLADKL